MASFVDIPKKLDWAMSFQRTGAFPLDRSTMFSSKADAILYAKGDGTDARGLGGTSFVGQVISVFENNKVTVYKINANRTLGEVGTVTAADEKSIHLSNDGILALMGLDTATENQQLRVKVVDGQKQIEWFTPDNSTVAGLQSAVAALQNTVGNSSKGLVKTVNTHTSQISEIQSKLTSVLHYRGSCAWSALPTNAEVGDVWNISSVDAGTVDVRGNTVHAGDNVIYIVDGETRGWDVSTGLIDLTGYYTKTQTDAQIKAAKDALEQQIQDVADNATKVEKSNTNGNVKVDGTEVQVYRLPTATTSAVGGVKASTAADKVNVGSDGVMSLNTVSASKVSGTVSAAAKVTNKLTVGSKTFDGSAAVTVTADDVPLPTDVVRNTTYATATVGGTVKSSTAKDQISVGSDGMMNVNTVSGSKISGAVPSASKVTNKLTMGSKTYDGSAAVEFTTDDLPLPSDLVRTSNIATTSAVGVVKASTAKDQINVSSDTGVMSINKVSGSKVEGAVATATNATKLGNVAATDILVANADTTLTAKVKAAAAADALATARTISITGAATGSATFDGSADKSINITLANSGATAGTYTKVTVNAKGLVTKGETLTASDIPNLTMSKITNAGALATKSEVARTDIAAAFETDIAALESAKHTHSNKTVLDGITSAKVTAWDKVSNKADKATTLAGYGITDAYTKVEVDGKLGGAFHYKGTKATFATLTTDVPNPSVGDVYNITSAGGTDSSGVYIKAGDNVVCKAAKTTDAAAQWDVLSGTVDLSSYYTKTETDNKITAAKNEVQGNLNTATDRIDALETTVGGASSGLVKDVTTLKSDMSTAKSNISTLQSTVGNASSGLVKQVNANKAAITTLNGADTVTGSVANAVKTAKDALQTNIDNITKSGGTIDSKISTHNTASDAHSARFNAKQNKIFQKDLTVTKTTFTASSDSEPGNYKAEFTISGVSTSASYKCDVVPVINNTATHKAILAAGFLPMTSFNAGKLTLYALNAPTADFTVSLTLTQIQ